MTHDGLTEMSLIQADQLAELKQRLVSVTEKLRAIETEAERSGLSHVSSDWVLRVVRAAIAAGGE